MIRLIEVANASINSFGTASPKADFVPPSEEQLVTVPASLLDSLKDEVAQLKDIVANLKAEVSTVTSTHEQDMNRLTLDIAFDRQRLSKLENPIKVSGKTEISRAEKIEKYLAARPDHKASFETLKGHLGTDKDLLHQAIKTLMDSQPGRYGIIRTPGDKRKRTLVMLPK